jgi:hypothetical protein
MSRHYCCDYLQWSADAAGPASMAFLANSGLASRDQGRIGIWNHRDTALNRINGRSRECFQR